jgi:hypothetical protein
MAEAGWSHRKETERQRCKRRKAAEAGYINSRFPVCFVDFVWRTLKFYQIPLFLKQCALVEGVLAKFLVAGILNTYHLMR